ncbi:hypothetical protein LBMAG42_43360 [Deltaproteobacteria bacterium]|nr:hypothetical protein LBMAG42_43360 [Deltaproteobacteria bacterium]
MLIQFSTESNAPGSPEAAFAFICDLTRWPLFTGYGPLPGIVEATVEGAVTLGSRIRVRNTDGSVHHEVVERFEPGRRYTIRMELNPPVSYVMASIEEDVELTAAASGTRIRRTFVLRPRSWFTAPIAWLFGGVLLPRAVARHNARMAAALA